MRRDLLAALAITALLIGMLVAGIATNHAPPADADPSAAFHPAAPDALPTHDDPQRPHVTRDPHAPDQPAQPSTNPTTAPRHDAARDPADPQARPDGPTIVVIGQPDQPGFTGRPADQPSQEEWDRLPAQPFAPDAGWADPAQQEILGPPRWMAQPSQGDARALAEAIDAGPAPAELKRQEDVRSLRQQAGLLVITRSPRCIDKWRAQDPTLRGQLIVDVSVVAAKGTASLTHVRVHAPILIEESGLSECVRSILQGERFPTRAESPAPVAFSFPLVVR
jgi:hypothetical protein